MLRLDYKWTPEELISKGKVTKEYIDMIRTWLDKLEADRTKLVPRGIQDESIVLFLMACNNDISLTKRTIVAFYECKRDAPELFNQREMDRSDVQAAMKVLYMSSIPVRTKENYVIHYFKLVDTNYKNFDLVVFMKLSYMLIDIAQEENPPDGIIVLIDSAGIGLMHLTKLKLGAIKKYIHFLQEGFPMQLKCIHIINSVYFVDKILEIVKVFMKAEILNMLKVHPPNMSQEKLFQLVPKECLPKDYGGDLPSAQELHEVTCEQYRNKEKFWQIEERIRKENL